MIEKKAFDLVKEFESFREKAYLCPAGVPTIGYGFTRVNGKSVKMSDTMNRVKAEGMLYLELEKLSKQIEDLVTVPLTKQQLGALTSFAFNVGLNAFKESTLRKKINRKDYQSAETELKRWNKINGKPSAGLDRRRKAELDLFFS
jgi:lysozyme